MRMRSVVPMKIAKYGYIAISLVLCVLGIVLVVSPEVSLKVICRFFGVALLIFGIIKVVGYFSKDLYRLAFQYDLQFGILFSAIGILALVRPAATMNVICIALGLSVFLDCLFKVKMIMEARRFGIKTWWLTLVLTILAAIAGFLLLVRPSEGSRVLAVLFGISLLTEGILNLDVAFSFVKIIKNQRPDVIDI